MSLAWDPVVPERWPVVPAAEAFTIVSGSTPKTSVPENWGGDIVWVTPDDQARGGIDVLRAGRRSITKTGLESCSTTLVPEGSVLLSSRAPIGYVSVAGTDLCTNQGFKTFVPRTPGSVTPAFMMWWLRANRDRIEALGSGTTFKELSKKKASIIPVPLPPLDEQREVVEAIERMLSHVCKARRQLDAIPGKALFARAALLNEAASTASADAPLGELAEVSAGPAFKSLGFDTSGRGVRLLRGANVGHREIDWSPETLAYWPMDQAADLPDLALHKGDIVLAIKRPVISTGLKIARLQTPDMPSLLVQGVARVRCEDPVLGSWVYLMMQRPRFIAEVLAQSGQSTGPPYASLTALRSTNIPMPRDLVSATSALEARLSLLEAAPRTVTVAATRVPALGRSVLVAAFEGRLTRNAHAARALDDIQEAFA